MADRIAVCDAYHAYLVGWNRDGLTERCRYKNRMRGSITRGIGVTLHRMGYKPSSSGTLWGDALEIYLKLVLRYEGIWQYKSECIRLGVK